MMMMSVDRQGEFNLLISQSGKKETRGICDWISFKSATRSIELALLISNEGGEGEVLCRYSGHHSFVLSLEEEEGVIGTLSLCFVDCEGGGEFGGRTYKRAFILNINQSHSVITIKIKENKQE